MVKRMKGLRWVDDVAKTGSWTCHRCLGGRQPLKSGKSPLWTFSVQRASSPRQSSYKRPLLEDSTLARSKLTSFSSQGSTLNQSSRKKAPGSKGKGRVLILAMFAIGSIWAFSDDAKHRYLAVKRAFRVFYALVQCLREYVLLAAIRYLQQC